MEKETIIKKLIKYNLNLLHRFLTFLHPLSTMPEEKTTVFTFARYKTLKIQPQPQA
jgi:hypothetical protein